MKVILLKTIASLGVMGEVKEVKDGYAQNFLFPQKLAVPIGDPRAAKARTAQSSAKASLEGKNKPQDVIIRGLLDKKVTIRSKAGEHKKLYAGINVNEIIEAVKLQLGIDLPESAFKRYNHIKTTGEHKIQVLINGQPVEFIVIVKELINEKSH